jgi:L-gulonolactone oxidase
MSFSSSFGRRRRDDTTADRIRAIPFQPPDAPGGFLDYFRNVIFGFHIVQFLLYIARFIPSFTPYVSSLVWKFVNGRTVRHCDDSWKIFNFDCLVSSACLSVCPALACLLIQRPVVLQFAQYTTEWAIPADRAPACLAQLQSWLAKEESDPNGIRIHFPIEIRWTDEDDIWLSPSSGRKTVYIGLVQFR